MKLDLSDGFDFGPLFNQRITRPSKKELHSCGWHRRQAEYASTPAWADRKAIAAIYRECRRLNKRDGARSWAVDHIVPLNNPIVCGFHMAVNLRIVPYNENALKSNAWWPDMQNEQIELFMEDV